MRELKQSTAANVMVFMTGSTDHVSGAAGLTLTITASKDGAAFASITPTVTERGNGWYSLALTTTHTDTLGDLAFHVTGAGADPSDFKMVVVANLEADTFARIGAAGAGLTALGDTRIANLDAAVSTRLATSGYTVPPTSSVISGAVWDLATSGHTTGGTFGAAMNAAGSAGDPWATTLPGSYTAGSAGYAVGHNLDAQVSTRSTYAGGAVASVTGNVGGNVAGSVGSVTAGVTVTTNNDKTGYSLSVTPPTAATIASTLLGTSGLTVRALDSIADASLTVGDCLVAAACGAAGKESVVGTTYTVKTPSTGTVIRTFALDSGTTPTTRS